MTDEQKIIKGLKEAVVHTKIMAVIEGAERIADFEPEICPTCGHVDTGQNDGELYDQLCDAVNSLRKANHEYQP